MMTKRYCLHLLLVLLALTSLAFTPLSAPAAAPLERGGSTTPVYDIISEMGPKNSTENRFFADDPAAAYDPVNNQYLVVWAGDDIGDGKVRIYGQFVNADTGLQAGMDDLLIAQLGADAGDPVVSYMPGQDKLMVAFMGRELDTGTYAIYTQPIIASTGALSGSKTIISQTSGARAPSIACTGNGECLVAWYTQNRSIYVQRVNAAGAEIGAADLNISTNGGLYPSAAWNPLSAQYLVVWQGDLIRGQRLTSTGAETGTNDFAISDAPGYNPSVAIHPTNGTALVAWAGESQNILSKTISSIGSMGSQATVYTGRASWPSVSYNANTSEFLAAWNIETGTFDYEMRGQRFSSSGTSTGTLLTLSNLNGWANPPSGVACGSGSTKTCLVVWAGTDAVTGTQSPNELEIFAEFYATNTTPSSAASIPAQTINELASFSYQVIATDPDKPPQLLTYSLSVKPDGMTVNASGLISWVPAEAQGPGDYQVTVQVTDNGYPAIMIERSFWVHVNEVNQNPTLNVVTDQSVNEHQLLTVNPVGADADLPSQTLTYSLDPGYPTGMSINSTSGAITWTPDESQGRAAPYLVTVRVSDNWSTPASATRTFNITVHETNASPTLDAIADQTIDEFETLTLTATGHDTDLPAQSLTYSLDPGFPSGMSIDSASGVITWTPDESQGRAGPYSVTVKVSDSWSTPASATRKFNVTVNETNATPALDEISDQTIDEFQTLSLAAGGHDTDIPTQALTYSLEPGYPAGMTINSTSGEITWTPNESQGRVASYPVSVKVSDSWSTPASATRTFNITVTETNETPELGAIGDRAVNEENELSFTISAADSDDPAQTLTYNASGLPAGAAFDPLTRTFTWMPSEVQGPGTYEVTFTVQDTWGPVPGSDSEMITITVGEVNQNPGLAAIDPQTIDEHTALTVQAIGSDGDLPSQTLTYTLEPGSPAGMSIDGASGEINWTPDETQGRAAPYLVTVRVSDNGSTPGSTTQKFNITVNETNDAPELDTIGDKAVTEEQELTFTVNAGDSDAPAQPLTYSATGLPTGATFDPATRAFTWTPTEAQGFGTYNVTFTVSDTWTPTSGSDSETITITVGEVNQNPGLAAIDPQTILEGTPLTLQPLGSDIDLPAQSLTYALETGYPSGMTIDSATGEIHWTPGEAQGPGDYPITVRLSDSSTPPGTTTGSFTIHVNEANQNPTLAAIAGQTIDEQTLLTLQAAGSDADLPAQTLTYSLEAGAPTGMTIDASTGVINWTPDETSGSGNFPVSVRVEDDFTSPGFAVQTFSIHVNETNAPPVLSAIGDKTVGEEQELSFTISASDSDNPAQAITYNATSLPAGAAFDPSTQTFTWTPTEAQGFGTYPVTFTTSDAWTPTAGSDSEIIMITVEEVNQKPVIDPVADTATDEGQAVTFTAAGRDLDLPAQNLTFSLDASAPSGAAITAGGEFSWTPGDAQGPGSYDITIHLTDDGISPEEDSVTFKVIVNEVNIPPVFQPVSSTTVDEGQTVSFTVQAHDSDIPAQTVTYRLADDAPAGATVHPTTGAFTWVTGEADGPASHDVRLIASDDGAETSLTVTITVNEVNQAPLLALINDETLLEGDTLTFTASATDNDLPKQKLTYALAAGVPANAAIDPDTGVFSWTTGDMDGPGVHPITVLGSDGLDEVSETFEVTVASVVALSLTGAEDKDPVLAGQNLLYTLTLENQDNDAAHNVIISAMLPGGVTLDAAGTDPRCSAAGSSLTCTIGTLDANSSLSLNVSGTVDFMLFGGTQLNFTSSVQSDETDRVLSNNSLSIQTKVVAQLMIYENDFENGSDAYWSDLNTYEQPGTSTTPGNPKLGTAPRGFLGEFNNQEILLELNDLPRHSFIEVSYDLYLIRSWDGNQAQRMPDSLKYVLGPQVPPVIGPDYWEFSEGEAVVFSSTFANWPEFHQTYPGPYPEGDNPAMTGAAETGTLGYSFGGQANLDSVYKFKFTLDHSDDFIRLYFRDLGLQELEDESWGLDNIKVVIITGAEPQPYKLFCPILSR